MSISFYATSIFIQWELLKKHNWHPRRKRDEKYTNWTRQVASKNIYIYKKIFIYRKILKVRINNYIDSQRFICTECKSKLSQGYKSGISILYPQGYDTHRHDIRLDSQSSISRFFALEKGTLFSWIHEHDNACSRCRENRRWHGSIVTGEGD